MKTVRELHNFAAFPLSKVKGKISNLADQIAIHTLLIYFYPNNKEINHWIKEVFTWLDQVSDNLEYKGGRKLKEPSVSTLIYGYEFEDQDDISKLESLISKYHPGLPKVIYEYDKLIFDIESIYELYIKYIFGNCSKTEIIEFLKNS